MDTNTQILKLYNEGRTYEEISNLIEPFAGRISADAIRKRVTRLKNRKDKDEEGNYKTKMEHEERVAILDELGEIGGDLFKIGVFDCETTGLWADFGYLLCAVIKDLHTGKYDILRLDETRTYNDLKFKNDPKNWQRIDKELLEEFRKVYETYDIIVTFNGRWFDMQFVNTRLLKNHLPALPDTKHIDIYNDIARRKLKLRSRRLDALKEFLEIDEEEDGHRWEYWQMAANGIKAGFDYVVEHCCRDVDRLEQVAKRVKSHIRIIGKW